MNISGGCFCGAIEYKAEIDENRVGVCHCRDCQIFSGSAFRLSSAVSPGSFEITKGAPHHFDKKADSGKVRRMAFCGTCGTHLSAAPIDPDEEGAFVSVRLATSKEFHKLKPAGELFCESRVAWMEPFDGALQFPRMP